MKIEITPIPAMLNYWESLRRTYDPPFFMLVLVGSAGTNDEVVWNFLMRNQVMLNDMSGPYASITVLARPMESADRAVPPEGPRHPSGLNYLHGLHPWQVDSPSVFGLAQVLSVPLDQIPAILITGDPWNNDGAGLLSLAQFAEATDGDDHDIRIAEDRLARFFSVVFTAARKHSSAASSKRVKLLLKDVAAAFPSEKDGRWNKFLDSGLISQIIEGIVKGVNPS